MKKLILIGILIIISSMFIVGCGYENQLTKGEAENIATNFLSKAIRNL